MSYGLGWERTIRATDFKFKWERSDESGGGLKSSGSSLDNISYVRKIEFLGGDISNEGVFCAAGRVTLIPYDSSAVDSVVECVKTGRTIASFSDLERAQKMNLHHKIEWFQGTCARFCSVTDGQVRIHVRQKHLLEDSVNVVMSLSREDLGKAWMPERERELGVLKLSEWYKTIVQEMFQSDAGLWQKCLDETRMEVNPLGGRLRRYMLCHIYTAKLTFYPLNSILFPAEMACPDHLKYFRFIGRILAKALIDKQTLRCRLAKHLYKLVLGWPISLDDLIDVDLEYHNFLMSLEAMGAGEIDNLGLHFTASEDCLGMKTRVPLVPNGFDIEVNDTNFPEYIVACFKYRLFERCKDQLSELLLGFFEVVPEPLLAVFDFQELEELMCGSYTGGKTEEGDIGDGRRFHSDEENVEEQSHEIINATTAFTINTTQIDDGEAEIVPDAIVTPALRHAASSASSGRSPQSSLPIIPEATFFDDEVYEAVQVDDSLKLGDAVHRIKLGQCPSCGIQTHEISGGMFNKKYRPLSNEHVLAGRCLLCNGNGPPLQIQFSGLATNAQVNNEIQHHLLEQSWRNMGGEGSINTSTTGGAAMNNSGDANPSPSSNNTNSTLRESSAAEEELEQRLADLRAILPDASNEELHEILGENDRASNKVETYIGRYPTRPFDMAEYTQQEERRNYDKSNFTRNGLERIPEATVFTDDTNAKAVRCHICSADLFVSMQAKSFICPRCGATCLDEGDMVRITSTLCLPFCRE